jgi:hypothetical protein
LKAGKNAHDKGKLDSYLEQESSVAKA